METRRDLTRRCTVPAEGQSRKLRQNVAGLLLCGNLHVHCCECLIQCAIHMLP